uniref:Uncharacterized protein n=1 Tax=Timema cristinae TaxID=61476 RepID=A0A7R9DET4_TIMCR|nr:unnamed protein product [Timema cristinae]
MHFCFTYQHPSRIGTKGLGMRKKNGGIVGKRLGKTILSIPRRDSNPGLHQSLANHTRQDSRLVRVPTDMKREPDMPMWYKSLTAHENQLWSC